MTRIFFVACAFVLGGAIGAHAQVGNTPTPPTPCPDCGKAAADAAPIRKAIQEKEAELRQQQQEQGINDANLNNVRQLRQEAARAKDPAAVEQHEQSIRDLEADRSANRTEQFNTQQEIERLNQELETIGRNVDDCAKQCGAKDLTLPTGNVTTGGTEIVV